MNPHGPPYQVYYNSPLLDELHNHFPAILYEPTRFQSVASLLAYIQVKMRERFDLFSTAQQVYRQSANYTRQPPGHRFPPAGPQPVAHQPPRPRQTEEVRVTMETVDGGGIHLLNAMLGLGRGDTGVERDLAELVRGRPQPPTTDLLNLLALLTPPRQAAAAGALEPVLVRPTAQQIDAGTTLEILDTEEEVCAICQDSMHAGEEVRAINVCDHRFHRNCIDTWFQRNVRCPVCRHDVREPAAEEEDTPSVQLEGAD
jgi:hypothetical protein